VPLRPTNAECLPYALCSWRDARRTLCLVPTPAFLSGRVREAGRTTIQSRDPQLPIVEDVATGECVQLPDLSAIPAELRRRLDTPTGDKPYEAEPGFNEPP